MHGVNRRRVAVAHHAERHASTKNLPSHTVTAMRYRQKSLNHREKKHSAWQKSDSQP
jgi:hypothetical protein